MTDDLVKRLREWSMEAYRKMPGAYSEMRQAADRIEALTAENERLRAENARLQARADAARREALEEASKVARDYASKAAQRGWVLKPGSIVTAARHIATTIRALKENPNAG